MRVFCSRLVGRGLTPFGESSGSEDVAFGGFCFGLRSCPVVFSAQPGEFEALSDRFRSAKSFGDFVSGDVVVVEEFFLLCFEVCGCLFVGGFPDGGFLFVGVFEDGVERVIVLL